jgi:hypothetical protein
VNAKSMTHGPRKNLMTKMFEGDLSGCQTQDITLDVGRFTVLVLFASRLQATVVEIA